MQVTIRPAAAADIDALASLLEILFNIEQDFSGDRALQVQGLHLLLDSPSGCILVAENDGRLIGMCTGQLLISTAEGGQALLVEDVVVEEPWRGRGVGWLLLEKLAEWATARGISRLQLLADRNNKPALEFYEKLGWQRTQLICLRKRV